MTINTAIKMNTLPMMNSYYFFTMARFFAGLFGIPKIFCPIRK